ncbi:MAG: hypothetical protein H7329_18025 [Opitutaceae bacterium]|nr:hypothetical protein [Cytophagales bacterium]
MGYTAKQINVGDQVFFNSTQRLSNHDLFWKVVEKKGSKLVIELKKYIWNEDSMIDITEVKGVLKNS